MILSCLLCASLVCGQAEDAYSSAQIKANLNRDKTIKLLDAYSKRQKVASIQYRTQHNYDDATASLQRSRDADKEKKRLAKGGNVLMMLNPRDLQTGMAGYVGFFWDGYAAPRRLPIEVRQVTGKLSFLAAALREGEPFMVKGLSTEGLADKDILYLSAAMAVTGTITYNTVAGSTKTVMVIEPVDVKAAGHARDDDRSVLTVEKPASR
jgi:hypothetical protein